MTVVEQWLCNKIYRKEIGEYLLAELYLRSIAIYGAGRMGEFLYDDLVGYKELSVEYFIDKNADALYYGIDDMNILNLRELGSAKEVEAIIVTPYLYFESIKKDLEDVLRYKTQIISLEDIICKVE